MKSGGLVLVTQDEAACTVQYSTVQYRVYTRAPGTQSPAPLPLSTISPSSRRLHRKAQRGNKLINYFLFNSDKVLRINTLFYLSIFVRNFMMLKWYAALFSRHHSFQNFLCIRCDPWRCPCWRPWLSWCGWRRWCRARPGWWGQRSAAGGPPTGAPTSPR